MSERIGHPVTKRRPEHYWSYIPASEKEGDTLYRKELRCDETSTVDYCSECGKRLCSRFTNYCPNCGVKIEEAEHGLQRAD